MGAAYTQLSIEDCRRIERWRHANPLLPQPGKRSGKLQLQTVQFAGIRSPRLLLPLRVRGSPHFFHHLFAEDLSGRFPSETFAGGVVEAVTDHLQVMISECRDVALPRQPSSCAVR